MLSKCNVVLEAFARVRWPGKNAQPEGEVVFPDKTRAAVHLESPDNSSRSISVDSMFEMKFKGLEKVRV